MWFVHEERNILIENASERVDEARQTMKLISQSCRDYIAMRTTPLQLYIPPPYVTWLQYRSTHVLCFFCVCTTGVNAAREAGDTSPPIFWLGVTSMGISPPILLRTFRYSRPILVVLAQWQHLMMSFIHCLLENPKFATESTQTPLRELTIKKNFKFSTLEFTKYAISRSQNKKFAPPRLLSGGEGNTPSAHPPPSALRHPNFELALAPLVCTLHVDFHLWLCIVHC